MTQQFSSWAHIQKDGKQGRDIHLYASVHNGVLHSSQKVETAQVPIKRRRDKQSGVCVYRQTDVYVMYVCVCIYVCLYMQV